MVVGALLFVAGLVVRLLGDKLRFPGRLPGDIRWESGHTKVFIPLTTMLLASLLLSLVFWITQRFGRQASW